MTLPAQATPLRREGPNPHWWTQLRGLPYFRALLRAVEADFYRNFELAAPVYDLGCGDGHFAREVFAHKLDVGLDPEHVSLREAGIWGAYNGLVQALGHRAPLPGGHFASAISNSVLEHIPNLQEVLNETGRLLAPGALFLFCVPNHRWQGELSVAKFLKKIGLGGLSRAYTRLFTRISRHINMLSPEEWQQRLGEAGFDIEAWWDYFPPAALHALEWGHYFGLPSYVARKLFGRWVLAPAHWNLFPVERGLQKLADGGADPGGTYTWYAARRR
jgi:SAM-dependent methyltransferase